MKKDVGEAILCAGAVLVIGGALLMLLSPARTAMYVRLENVAETGRNYVVVWARGVDSTPTNYSFKCAFKDARVLSHVGEAVTIEYVWSGSCAWVRYWEPGLVEWHVFGLFYSSPKG